MGKHPARAAADGAIEVGRPVIFSVLTTMAAFSPLLFTKGRIGKFMYSIPIIVLAVLSVSLIESLFVLPAHLSGCWTTSQSSVRDGDCRHFRAGYTDTCIWRPERSASKNFAKPSGPMCQISGKRWTGSPAFTLSSKQLPEFGGRTVILGR